MGYVAGFATSALRLPARHHGGEDPELGLIDDAISVPVKVPNCGASTGARTAPERMRAATGDETY